jgi:hypothetical protein
MAKKKREFKQAFLPFGEPRKSKKKARGKQGLSLETWRKIDSALQQTQGSRRVSQEQAIAALRKYGLRGLEIYPAIKALSYGEENMRRALEGFRAWRERKNEVKKQSAGEIHAWLKRHDVAEVQGRLIDFIRQEKKPTKAKLLELLSLLEKLMAEEISADAERYWRQSVSRRKG